LDGDHRPSTAIQNKGALPQGKEELDSLISDLTRGPNSKGPDLDFVDVDERVRYIEFLRASVRYLPGKTPEELVWSESVAAQVLGKDLPKNFRTLDVKERIREVAAKSLGHNDDSVFRVMLSAFLMSNSPEARELSEMVRELRTKP